VRPPDDAALPDRHPAVGGRERGSASVQLVVLMPALFAVMFLGMQGALFYHARAVALAAAQEGVRTAAGMNGTREAGVQDAYLFVDAAGGDDVLVSARVSASRTVADAQVTVAGRSLSVIPGWSPWISQSAHAPVERITQ